LIDFLGFLVQKLTQWLLVYKYIVLGNRGKKKDIPVDLPTVSANLC